MAGRVRALYLTGPAEDHEDMAEYGMEPRSTEHRCQCCGNIAEGVFCEDCMAHVNAGAEHGAPEFTAPVAGRTGPHASRPVWHDEEKPRTR